MMKRLLKKKCQMLLAIAIASPAVLMAQDKVEANVLAWAGLGQCQRAALCFNRL